MPLIWRQITIIKIPILKLSKQEAWTNFVIFFLCFRKNVPDYSAGRAKNDLGFVMFDLQSDILFIFACLLNP